MINSDVTFATMFSGIGGVEEAIRSLSGKVLWGLENDPQIQKIAVDNGHPTRLADVTTTDFTKLPTPTVLHASPVCKAYSLLNHDTTETPIDIASAIAVCAALDVHNPEYFTLENVIAYEKSEAFSIILSKLHTLGYTVYVDKLYAKNYGVPQTRLRLIVRASMHTLPEVEGLPHNGWGYTVDPTELIPKAPTPSLQKVLPDVMPYNSAFATCYFNECLWFVPERVFPTLTSSGINYKGALYWDGLWYDLPVSTQLQIQTFPKEYKLNCSKTVAIKGIGNAVPPNFYKQIVKSLLS